MPLRLPLLRRLRIVDDSYKPVPVVPNIKDDVAFDRIDILERSADLIKIVPANRLDNGGPGCNLVRCIWVVAMASLRRLRVTMCTTENTSQYVKYSSAGAEAQSCSDIWLRITDLSSYFRRP
jgi:hypothetical protein